MQLLKRLFLITVLFLASTFLLLFPTALRKKGFGELDIKSIVRAQTNQVLNLVGGGTATINCSGSEIIGQYSNLNRRLDVNCLPTNTPSPTTALPSPTNSPTPSPIGSPTSTPTPPPGGLTSPYGIYPNCIAPAVGLETHSWWLQNGEKQPRHLHLATCLPNSRGSTGGGGVTVSGIMPAVFRIMSFNNPGPIGWVRYAWQSSVIEVKSFNPPLQCQASPNEFKECTWYVAMNIDTSKSQTTGNNELRLTPNIQHPDLGTRQFLTNNFQISRGGSTNYRSSPAPIARSWYTGLDYANVTWNNYMNLFRSLSESVPTVSGTISVNVTHASCNGTSSSAGFIDTDFHALQRDPAASPMPTPPTCGTSGAINGACQLYNQSGCWSGTVSLDTRRLPNGTHTVYLQTQERDSHGLNAGAMKYLINVQN